MSGKKQARDQPLPQKPTLLLVRSITGFGHVSKAQCKTWPQFWSGPLSEIALLLDAIRQVLRGDIYLSPKMTNRFLQSALQGIDNSEDNPIKSLSDRELEVFTHLGQGHNRHEIADALYISVKTVETHRAHLMEKLNLKNATELTRYALYWVSPPERS